MDETGTDFSQSNIAGLAIGQESALSGEETGAYGKAGIWNPEPETEPEPEREPEPKKLDLETFLS